MNLRFRNGFTITQMVLCIAVLALFAAVAIPKASAQVDARRTRAFSNAPATITLSSVTNATLNANSYRSNMVPVQFGKGLGIISSFQQASNGTAATAATVTHYFGLVFNRTNTPTYTNFTWVVAVPPTAAGAAVFTNIPASVIDNADGVVWLSTQTLTTNTIINNQLLSQQP